MARKIAAGMTILHPWGDDEERMRRIRSNAQKLEYVWMLQLPVCDDFTTNTLIQNAINIIHEKSETTRAYLICFCKLSGRKAAFVGNANLSRGNDCIVIRGSIDVCFASVVPSFESLNSVKPERRR